MMCVRLSGCAGPRESHADKARIGLKMAICEAWTTRIAGPDMIKAIRLRDGSHAG